MDGEGAETVNAENVPDDKASQQQVAEPKAALQAICTDKNVRQFDLEEQRQQDVVSKVSFLVKNKTSSITSCMRELHLKTMGQFFS